MVIPRKEGGRGIIDIKNLHNKQILALREYIYSKQNIALHQAVKLADKECTPLNLAKEIVAVKVETVKELTQKWARKPIFGKYYRELTDTNIDQNASNKWLTQGELYRETESFLIAIQDGILPTRNYQKHIMKIPNIRDDCRRCGEKGETIEHIIGACKNLANEDYLVRHNNVAKVVHQKLAYKYDLVREKTPIYKYEPEVIIESPEHKIMWDRSVITDKPIRANRPDVILIDKNKKHTYLIDIAVPNNNNIMKTYNEKINKYQELAQEVKRIWNQNEVKIVPIVLSSTGIIPKNLFISLSSLDLPRNTFMEMQKQAILTTCRITRKFFD